MPDVAVRCADMLADMFPDGGAWSVKEIAAILAREGGYVFENEGGFLIVNAVPDEAEIWTIAIREGHRRQGFARRLVSQAVEKMVEIGVTQVFLEVAEDNAAARALYQSIGFSETGRRPGYYRAATGGRTDAILMALKIGR